MPDPTDPRAVADGPSGIVQQMPEVEDEGLSELRPCPFCGGPVSFQGAAIRCNSFSCNASMSPRWTKVVVGSAKADPDERFALAKADCQRRWNIRATEADLRAEVERLQSGLRITAAVLQAERARTAGKPFSGSWSIPNCGWRGSVDDALDLANAALSPETDGGQDG